MAEGHRKRIKDRIRKQGIESLTPLEVLEFVLYPFVPRADTVPIAKRLLQEFGSLNGIFHASENSLLEVDILPRKAAIHLANYRKVVEISARNAFETEERLVNSKIAGEYLINAIGSDAVENVYCIFLNVNSRVIATKKINEGVSDKAQVPLRKIINLAIENGSYSVIFAHNHPSGNVQPSADDIATTETLFNLLTNIGVHLADHIIASRTEYFSFRDAKILPRSKYNTQLVYDGVEVDS